MSAASKAQSGASIDEVSSAATDPINRTQVHAALDTLENLRKNGRIGAAGSLLGSMLSIKPIKIPKVHFEVRKTAIDRHRLGQMSPFIYQLLTKGNTYLIHIT